ncbi:S49 family peptidase [Vulgatibacter sp.]|uniref:S49 family peptidase n=1 Tax=Vulgatibacter sp. TaxID=1971226 RepID=UPI00356413E1
MLLDLLLTPLRLLVAILRLLARLVARPKLPDFVDYRLAGTLRWRDLHRRRWAFGRRRSGPTVHGLLRSFAEVEREPAVRGVVLRVEKLHASRARLLALRAGLERLRAAGKEVVLYWKHADNRHFALVPAASRVVLAPGGPVHLLGYAAAVTVLREALDNAGVLPEFVRKGQFKTAPERFTEREVTPEHRDLVERVLTRAYENLVTDLSTRRGGDEGWARAVIDGGPYTSRRALAAGLVDHLAFPDELPQLLARSGASAEKPPDATLAGPGRLHARKLWQMRWPRFGRGKRVAVVPLSGLIKPGKSFRWPGGSEMAGDESVGRALDDVRKDRSVGAVIFTIESRGGAANASELIWHAVRRCAAAKPTVALVEGVAASGGYFAACGASHIVAAPGALVGSIGVFSGRFDARALLDRIGVRQEVILRGARAGILEPAHSLTDGDRAVLAAEVDNIYVEFVDRVAEGRGRSADEIRAHAEGRVFLGADAPAALVDRVGDFRDALAWVCSEAGLDPARVEVRAHERAGVRPDLGQLFSLAQSALSGMPLLLWAEELESPDWL